MHEHHADATMLIPLPHTVDTVPCPVCKAAPGLSCMSLSTGGRVQPMYRHLGRQFAYAEFAANVDAIFTSSAA